MSRSNPNTDTPNPSQRWFEWAGKDGVVRYWDKEKKEQVECKLPFTFLVLDQTATVKGWHEPSESGIFSNEVRKTSAEPLVVKSFKGGPLAQGMWADIKDRVGAAGGHYVANIYIAFKLGGELAIGSLQLKGAALSAWFEWQKKHRAEVSNQAVSVTGSNDGKKGSVVFKTPVFAVKEVTQETNDAAIALDRQLQEYLEGYFKRTLSPAVKPVAEYVQPDSGDTGYQPDPMEPEPEAEAPSPIDDVPF